MILSLESYRDKVLGCWMGKNIGGTLGMPFEFKRQVNNVKFYTQELKNEPAPNDDLDLQIVWLIAMEEKGIDINANLLAEYWLYYITPHFSEYGTAKVNLRAGLVPPLSGILNNEYKNSNGSFIRSEIWACIAPGCPQTAARYAYEDAVVDHGDGEGVYGEIFCTTMQSAAFLINDIKTLIKIGLSYIPDDCGTAKAVRTAIQCYESGKTWLEAREKMLAEHRGYQYPQGVSKEDLEKEFHKGKRGWDVPVNIGMIIIGMLYGEGDFEKSITTIVNCGEDTDCTAATYGALYGIMNGIESIPQKWKEPIGRKIKTMCLNQGELSYGINQIPQTIDEFAKRIEIIAKKVIDKYDLPVKISSANHHYISEIDENMMMGFTLRENLYRNLGCAVYHFDFYDVVVDYRGSPVIKDNMPKEIALRIENKYKTQEMLNIRIFTPNNWNVTPREGKIFVVPSIGKYSWQPEKPAQVQFKLYVEKVEFFTNRCAVEITIEGRHTVMYVPIVLLNGNML